MEREDWNWVALLCMGQLFSAIIKTIIYETTGIEIKFWGFMVIYGAFYFVMSLLFSNSVFNHKKFFIPMIIYLIIALCAVVLTGIISITFNIKTFEELLMYIMIAVLGVLVCGISRLFYNK